MFLVSYSFPSLSSVRPELTETTNLMVRQTCIAILDFHFLYPFLEWMAFIFEASLHEQVTATINMN